MRPSSNQPETEGTSALGKGLAGSIIGAVGGLFVIRVVGQGLLFGTMILVARLVGDRPYGQFIFYMAWARIVGVGIKAGYDTSLLRYLPAFVTREKWGQARGVLHHSLTVVIGLWILLVVFGGGIGSWLAHGWFVQNMEMIAWGAVVVLVMSMSEILVAVLQGWDSPVRAFVPNLILRPAALGLSVWWLIRLRGVPSDGALLLACNTVAFVVCLLVLTFWAVQESPRAVREASTVFERREWSRTAVSMLFISGVHLVLAQTDTIMVGILRSPTESGYYSSAGRLAGLVLFGLVAANGVVAPAISAFHARGEIQEMQSMFDVVSRWILAFALPVGLTLVVAGRFLLGLWGEAFVTAYPVLVVLVIAQTVNVWGGPVGFLMTMTGRQNLAAWVLGGSALLNVVLNFCLIPIWGMLGASIATGITVVLWNLVLVTYASRSLGLRTTVLWPRKGSE